MRAPAERRRAREVGTVTSAQPVRLGFVDAMESPCASCDASPCCSYLPVQMFRVDHVLDLDRARYLLNFERIELGLAATGDWTVYYRYPCRFLDRRDFSCSLHGQPERPNICVQYNPFKCWYRRALNEQVTDEFVRVDRRRIEWVADHTVFEANGTLAGAPPWSEMILAFDELPAVGHDTFDTDPRPPDAFADWKAVVLGPTRRRRAAHAAVDAPVAATFDAEQPCSACAAPCCQLVVFPLNVPTDVERLDFIRFALGFPGVEIGITETGDWTLAVSSTCRHFEDGECSVFGMSERPLVCSAYDEFDCSYRREFLPARSPDRVRVRHEEFAALAGLFVFDDQRHVVEVPQAAEVRDAIESAWTADSAVGHP